MGFMLIQPPSVSDVKFEAVASWTGSASANLTLTTKPGATVIVAQVTVGNRNAATLDGVDMTYIGSNGTSVHLYAMHGVAAGSHSISVTRTTSSQAVVAVSYTGASAVAGFATSTGSGLTMSVNPPGAGGRVLMAAHAASNSGITPAYSSSGEVRAFDQGTISSRIVLADAGTAPITITQAGDGTWEAVGAWLT